VRNPFTPPNWAKLAVLTAVAVLCCLSSPEAQSAPQRRANPQPSPDVVFHSGTRLVEIEVVVRDKKGPVKGLTREDFTLLDAGKRQKIAVFNASTATGDAHAASTTAMAGSLPAGVISNRTDRTGTPVSGVTVLLMDQLNTSINNQGYSRNQLLKYLDSVGDGEQIAIYLLGRNLSVVQDFTDNSETLKRAVRHFNPETLLVGIWNTASTDSTDREIYGDNPIYRAIRSRITTEAVETIAQHLAGVPGRKSLVWLSDSPGTPGIEFLSAADIHVYPVLVRGVGSTGVFAWLNATRGLGPGAPMPSMSMGNDLARQRANSAIAASSGGIGFDDSSDVSTAVRTAVEDASNAYVLGFYPAGETLDNKFHLLTVKVSKKGAERERTLDTRYRAGYLATAAPARMVAPRSRDAVLRNPLDATAIAITAVPSLTANSYQVTATVDLHGIHFAMQDNRHVGSVQVSIADDASEKIETRTWKLSFSDAEFAASLERGLTVSKVWSHKTAVRIVARDVATGVVGSLRVVPAEAPVAETHKN
jgi:VWFA-related protein